MGRGSGSATADVSKPIFIGAGGEGYLVVGQDLTDAVEPYIRICPEVATFIRIGRTERLRTPSLPPRCGQTSHPDRP